VTEVTPGLRNGRGCIRTQGKRQHSRRCQTLGRTCDGLTTGINCSPTKAAASKTLPPSCLIGSGGISMVDYRTGSMLELLRKYRSRMEVVAVSPESSRPFSRNQSALRGSGAPLRLHPAVGSAGCLSSGRRLGCLPKFANQFREVWVVWRDDCETLCIGERGFCIAICTAEGNERG